MALGSFEHAHKKAKAVIKAFFFWFIFAKSKYEKGN